MLPTRLTRRLMAVVGLDGGNKARFGTIWERVTDRVLATPDRHGPPEDPSVLDLNTPFPTDGPAVSGVRATADRRPVSASGLPALRSVIAEVTGTDPDSGVLVTAGATGAFLTTLDAFAAGRPVVLLAPCSPLFATAARSRRCRVRWVPTHVEGDRLRLDFDTLSRAMRGAALCAVADPGNPVGVPLADDDADRLRWAAERSDVLLSVDETFARFRDGPRQLATLAPHRTLVAGSVSAAAIHRFGSAGWRGRTIWSGRAGWPSRRPPGRCRRSASNSPGAC